MQKENKKQTYQQKETERQEAQIEKRNGNERTQRKKKKQNYEESVVDKFKSNLLLMIFWLNIINYNS
jgi:hypothetical protein